MSLFQGKYRVKTWQELSASVATDSDLTFQPVKRLPKKVQQGKHNYKTQKGWFKRQKIKENASLISGTGSLSRGFFIYDSGSNVAYTGYPSQSFMDDMMEMLGSQSFATSSFNQISQSFTNVNWPDIVVIQEEYSASSANISVGWDAVAVMLTSSNWSTDPPSASVNFINTSTDDIGMMQSFNTSTTFPGTTRPGYSTSDGTRLKSVWEFTLPVTTASFSVKSDSTSSGHFSASFHLTGLTTPGYTASDGTINTAYTQNELLDSVEWNYTGSEFFGTDPHGVNAITKGKGIGDAHQTIVTKDHDGTSLNIKSTQQEVKSQIFDDTNATIDDSPTQYPSTIAIFSSFGGDNGNITSSVCKRYDYDDIYATGSFDNVTIYYVTKGTEQLGLGHSSGLGSFIFSDSDLKAAASPGVYKDFVPAVVGASSTASGAFITTQTSSMSQLIRFSGSAT